VNDLPRMQAQSPADERLQALSVAIARDPEAAAGYLLRGEAYAERGLHVLAEADFRQAIAVGERSLARARWGIVDQVVRDRADWRLQAPGEEAW
jgi:tetratricopeptide (TPR) repeat protein